MLEMKRESSTDLSVTKFQFRNELPVPHHRAERIKVRVGDYISQKMKFGKKLEKFALFYQRNGGIMNGATGANNFAFSHT